MDFCGTRFLEHTHIALDRISGWPLGPTAGESSGKAEGHKQKLPREQTDSNRLKVIFFFRVPFDLGDLPAKFPWWLSCSCQLQNAPDVSTQGDPQARTKIKTTSLLGALNSKPINQLTNQKTIDVFDVFPNSGWLESTKPSDETSDEMAQMLSDCHNNILDTGTVFWKNREPKHFISILYKMILGF